MYLIDSSGKGAQIGARTLPYRYAVWVSPLSALCNPWGLTTLLTTSKCRAQPPSAACPGAIAKARQTIKESNQIHKQSESQWAAKRGAPARSGRPSLVKRTTDRASNSTCFTRAQPAQESPTSRIEPTHRKVKTPEPPHDSERSECSSTSNSKI